MQAAETGSRMHEPSLQNCLAHGEGNFTTLSAHNNPYSSAKPETLRCGGNAAKDLVCHENSHGNYKRWILLGSVRSLGFPGFLI